jgi:hypothetical protein
MVGNPEDALDRLPRPFFDTDFDGVIVRSSDFGYFGWLAP